MSVADHLGISLKEYDARIRTFIPHYEEMLDVAADAVRLAGASPLVLDLGIGTGALSARVLRVRPRARIVGIDGDRGMLGTASRRLGGRLTPVPGNFERLGAAGTAGGGFTLPARRADAITASFALHHVPTQARKARLYTRVFRALGSRGLVVNADCCPPSTASLRREGLAAWRDHLARRYGRRRAETYLRAWARDDVYFALDDEVRMLRAAGFAVEVLWRRDAFAVLLGLKGRRAR